MTTEDDAEAFNNCTEADFWLVDAATDKFAERMGDLRDDAEFHSKILTAAQLIALSDRERSIYRGALAYASGTAPGQHRTVLRSDGKVWQPRSRTWAPLLPANENS